MIDTEVLIVGGGVIGAAIARELSRYRTDVTLVEREADIGWGCTKANVCLVCQGADCLQFRPEYHESRLAWKSMSMMEPLCQELDVPFQRVGELAVFWNNEEMAKYRKLKSRAEAAGICTHELIGQERLREMEPNISREAIGAMLDPLIAIVDPVRLAMALVENARLNGVNVLLGTDVLAIAPTSSGFEVTTSSGPIRSRYVVNAAGVAADKVARLVNADDFVVYPVKAQIAVLDKRVGDLVRHEVHCIPESRADLNWVTPTVHGNLFYGAPIKLSRRGDYSTEKRLAEKALRNARQLVPAISEKDVIHHFVGYMMFRNFEVGWHECVVRPSRKLPRFINAFIGMPGVSISPAVAEEVTQILAQQGLNLAPNPAFNPRRKSPPAFAQSSDEERERLVAGEGTYGHVVCRCETVTEGEVVQAIQSGATTLDGVKFRTRAGMGRCQAGFCGPRVTRILARELGVSEKEITKRGEGSAHLLYRSKELLTEGEG